MSQTKSGRTLRTRILYTLDPEGILALTNRIKMQMFYCDERRIQPPKVHDRKVRIVDGGMFTH